MTNSRTATHQTLLPVAQEHGWTVHTSPRSDSLTLKRGRESLAVFVYPSGEVSSYSGFIAAGQVATRQVRSCTADPARALIEVTNLLTAQRAAQYPASLYAVVVTAGQHQEAEATASNFSTHELTAGTYPLEFTTLHGQAVFDDAPAYFGLVAVPTTLVRTYAVNRLLTATSIRDEAVSGSSEVIARPYAADVEPGLELLSGHARIVQRDELRDGL